jgi:hypothetical protein
VRLCGWPPALVAMAVEVSAGYVRWVGVWAWEGRAARGAQWDGMKCKERGAEWAGGGVEREWDGRASGFDGARRARVVLKSLYYYPLALGACPVRRGALCCTHRGTRPCACVRPFAWVRPDALLNQKRGSPSDARRVLVYSIPESDSPPGQWGLKGTHGQSALYAPQRASFQGSSRKIAGQENFS